MNYLVMLLLVLLMTLFSCLQATAEIAFSDSDMLPQSLREETVQLLSDYYDTDENFSFIELATGSYLVFTESGIYSLDSLLQTSLEELYRTGDFIEFVQTLYDNENGMALIFAHHNMRAGIISEAYVMLQVDKTGEVPPVCHQLYIFLRDSESGGNGLDEGEKVMSVKLLDWRSGEEPMVGLSVDCENYVDGRKWKELVVFRKKQNQFRMLTRRRLLR